MSYRLDGPGSIFQYFQLFIYSICLCIIIFIYYVFAFSTFCITVTHSVLCTAYVLLFPYCSLFM
jgi:hypothetical protein